MSDAAPPLPASREAEQALLGCLFHDNDKAWIVRTQLQPQDFDDVRNTAVYAALLTCLDRGLPANLVTVTELMRDTTAFEGIGVDGLAEYHEAAIDGKHAEQYAAIVLDASQRRSLMLAAQKAIEIASTSGQEIGVALARAGTTMLRAIGERSSPRLKRADAIVAEIRDDLAKPEHAGSGLSAGFPDLDRLLGGLQPGSSTIVGGRPSMGKTAFANAVAGHVAVRNSVPTLMFSLEVPTRQLTLNLVCAEARVSPSQVRRNTLTTGERQRLEEALRRIEKSPLIIDDTPGLTVDQIAATMRVERERSGIQLAIVDYLQLICTSRRADVREQEVAVISATLKTAARDCGVALIALSQLNRASEGRKDKRPKMSELRESGALEQDADAVLLLHRPAFASGTGANDSHDAQICVAKNRNGPTGKVDLVFHPQFVRFDSAVQAEDMPADWNLDDA